MTAFNNALGCACGAAMKALPKTTAELNSLSHADLVRRISSLFGRVPPASAQQLAELLDGLTGESIGLGDLGRWGVFKKVEQAVHQVTNTAEKVTGTAPVWNAIDHAGNVATAHVQKVTENPISKASNDVVKADTLGLSNDRGLTPLGQKYGGTVLQAVGAVVTAVPGGQAIGPEIVLAGTALNQREAALRQKAQQALQQQQQAAADAQAQQQAQQLVQAIQQSSASAQPIEGEYIPAGSQPAGAGFAGLWQEIVASVEANPMPWLVGGGLALILILRR